MGSARQRSLAVVHMPPQSAFGSPPVWRYRLMGCRDHPGMDREVGTPPQVHGEQRLLRGAHGVGQARSVVDGAAGRHGAPRLLALAPVGGAREDEVELL